jgi:hypothetical protein
LSCLCLLVSCLLSLVPLSLVLSLLPCSPHPSYSLMTPLSFTLYCPSLDDRPEQV